MRVQGRWLEPEAVEAIRELIRTHPEWSRRRLSEVLCRQWDWRNGAGRLKDMATRSLLVKLEARGLIELPARRRAASNRMAAQGFARFRGDRSRLRARLTDVGALEIEEVSRQEPGRRELEAALAEFHYLGYRGSVGENLQYTVRDEGGRLLAGLVFGSAAWQCAVRDRWIGWSAEERTRRLHLITNNMRFLILPWVEVRYLAGWVLSRVLRRLSQDWEAKYGHRIVLVETFVESERFRGTCYRAANWRRLGETRGRSRQDREHRLRVATKTVYVYPLVRQFRRGLGT